MYVAIEIWRGKNKNFLGDTREQILVKVTEELGLSILCGGQRVDYLYGLPDVLIGETNVAVIKFLTKEECGNIAAHTSGFYFRPVGYIGSGDSHKNWESNDIKFMIERIELNGLDGIQPDSYYDEYWSRLNQQWDIRNIIRTNNVTYSFTRYGIGNNPLEEFVISFISPVNGSIPKETKHIHQDYFEICNREDYYFFSDTHLICIYRGGNATHGIDQKNIPIDKAKRKYNLTF